MTGRQDRFQELMNQGHSAAWDQTWDKAALCYRQALEEFPDHPTALISLGLALLELQQYTGALDCYRQAADVQPGDPVPLEKIGQIGQLIGQTDEAAQSFLKAADLQLKRGDTARAIDDWTQVTHLDPLNLQARSRLAILFERQGRKNEAVEAYLVVASLIQHAGDARKALQAVQYALQILPEHPASRQALAAIKAGHELPLPAGAEPAEETSLARPLDPKVLQNARAENGASDPIQQARQKALTLLAGVLFESAEAASQGTRRDLSAIMRGAGGSSAEQLRQDAQVRAIHHLGQAITAQVQGQDGQAVAELEKAVEAGFTHPAAHYVLGLLGSADGRGEAALRDLQAAVQHPEFALASRLLTGQLLRKTGRLSDAAVEYLEALKIADAQTVPVDQAGDLSQLYEPIIESLRQQSDPTYLTKACDNLAAELIRPNWQDHLRKARQQMDAEAPASQSLPLAEMILEAHSNRVLDALATVRQLSSQNHLRAAMEAAYQALEIAPTYLPLHVQMAELLLQGGCVESAVEKFTLVAKSYSLRGQPDQSVSLLRRLIALAPMDLSLRGRLLEQLEASGKDEEAIKTYLELGELYYRQADLEQARATYQKALPLAGRTANPRQCTADLLTRIADIDMQRLDWRQSLRGYEQVRQLQPEDPKVRLALIDLNLRMGQDKSATAELDGYLGRLEQAGLGEASFTFLRRLTDEHPDWVEAQKRLALMQISV